jgi:hypothetical protein
MLTKVLPTELIGLGGDQPGLSNAVISYVAITGALPETGVTGKARGLVFGTWRSATLAIRAATPADLYIAPVAGFSAQDFFSAPETAAFQQSGRTGVYCAETAHLNGSAFRRDGRTGHGRGASLST